MNDALKQLVRSRAHHCCEYCQIPQSLSSVRHQMDHIIAEKHRGKTLPSNLALCCFHCNLFKGANVSSFDPITHKHVQLFHPRRNKWSIHFFWDGIELVGKTPKGRATVEVLKLNDSERLNHRELLSADGLFPWPDASAR